MIYALELFLLVLRNALCLKSPETDFDTYFFTRLKSTYGISIQLLAIEADKFWAFLHAFVAVRIVLWNLMQAPCSCFIRTYSVTAHRLLSNHACIRTW
jgi:hypothetical protein